MRNNATLQGSLLREFDSFGRHRASLEAALGMERAAQADALGAPVLLAATVAQHYIQLARLFEHRALAQCSLQQLEDALHQIQQHLHAGLETALELRQGKGAVTEARQAIEALDEQIGVRGHALAALTVQPPSALDSLAPHLAGLHRVPLPKGVPANLLARRADIDAARRRAEAVIQNLT